MTNSNKIELNTKFLDGFVSQEDLDGIFPEVEKAHGLIKEGKCPGSAFLGWLDLPDAMPAGLVSDIEERASMLMDLSDVLIVTGIGGSYLGARAAIEMMGPAFGPKKVLFAGNNISGAYLKDLLDFVDDKDISVNVISKSGTTTEPAIAFRILEEHMKGKYGKEELKKRIVCTTDKEKGALKKLADSEGYESYVIPDDVGGRFSVLTPVGLLPIACAGIDIKKILLGAKDMMAAVSGCDLEDNLSYRYAANRNILARKGKAIEILSNFDPKLHYVSEWWKQLFGESEGKDAKGIFPASCDFTTDLHSMGQWIQDGARDIFETFLVFADEGEGVSVPEKGDDLDNLNYLKGKEVSYVNGQAYLATAEAHFEGGVPNSTVVIPERSGYFLGQLFYFFEKAVAVSALVSGVNPFNQPGVESYKSKMFKLLGKPGA